MVYSRLVTISVTGTAQPLYTVRTPASWVALQAGDNNAEDIYHGGNMTTNNGEALTTSNGQTLSSGSGGGPPQYPPGGSISMYDLAKIFIIGTSGDTVKILWCRP